MMADISEPHSENREGSLPAPAESRTGGISEPGSKKKRGRPPGALTPEIVTFIRGTGGDMTRRSMQNMLFEGTANTLLREEPNGLHTYRWLIGASDKDTRRSVLAELGRFEDPDTIRAMARAICKAGEKEDLSCAEAKARLRRARLQMEGKEPKPASIGDLADALLDTIARYQAEHPDCTAKMADTAVWRILDVIRTAVRAERDAGAGAPAAVPATAEP